MLEINLHLVKKIHHSKVKKILFTIILMGVSYQLSMGQLSQFSTNGSNSISLEWQKPNFDLSLDNNDDLSSFTSVLFIKSKYKLNDRINILIELPFSHWGLNDPDGIDNQDNHTTLGNIYLGSRYRFDEKSEAIDFSIELGLRVPTIPEPDFPDKRGSFTGLIISKDRREAFMYDFIPLNLFGYLQFMPDKNLTFHVTVGGLYSIYTGDLNRDNESHILYSLSANYKSEFLNSSIGFSDRRFLKQNNFIFQEKNNAHLWLQFSKPFQNWEPSLYMKLPVKDEPNFYTYILGFSLSFSF